MILGVVALACDARGLGSPYQLGIIAANSASSGNFIRCIIMGKFINLLIMCEFII